MAPLPPVVLKGADDSALTLLAGDQLLHTDLNPHNILIGEHARIIDWAWPTLGAAWVDAACATLWLIAEGHSPAAAETWAAGIPAWAPASRPGIDVFTTIGCHLWGQIAHDDPQPWKLRLHAATQAWAAHRMTAMSASGGVERGARPAYRGAVPESRRAWCSTSR